MRLLANPGASMSIAHFLNLIATITLVAAQTPPAGISPARLSFLQTHKNAIGFEPMA